MVNNFRSKKGLVLMTIIPSEVVWSLLIYGYILIDVLVIIASIHLIEDRPFMIAFLPVMPFALIIYFIVWLTLPQRNNVTSEKKGGGQSH